jgi:hypothetical protein
MVNYTRDVKEGCSKATLRLYYFPEHFEQVSLASQLLSHLAGVLFLTRTLIFRSHIPKRIADDLNQESARHYTNVMKWHWRIYRKHGIWLSPSAAEKLEDYLGQGSTLHAHSRDAAQQAFYKACKTTRTRRKQGDPEAKFPHKRKRYRTTYWKNTGIYKVENGVMFLSRAQGLERVRLRLPRHLTHLQKEDILEVRLVFNRKNKRYDWHFVVNDLEPSPPPGDNVMAVDMGEIHPAVASDPEQAVLFSTRELRALYQYRNKRLAQFQEAQSRCLNYSGAGGGCSDVNANSWLWSSAKAGTSCTKSAGRWSTLASSVKWAGSPSAMCGTSGTANGSRLRASRKSANGRTASCGSISPTKLLGPGSRSNW